MNLTGPQPEKECFEFYLGLDDQNTTGQIINVLLAVLNFLTSLFAVVENSILILTIWKNANLHDKPSFVLLGCLAVSDLLTGFFSQPSLAVYSIAKHYRNWTVTCNAMILSILSMTLLSGVSISTLTIISIDRFLALHYHLRYGDIVTVKRVLILFAGLWPVFFILLIPRILGKLTLFTIVLSVGCTICLFIILTCYWKIYKITEKHRTQIQDLERAMQHASGQTDEQIKSGKKSSLSFFIVTVIFLGVSIPYLIFCILLIVIGFRGFVVQLGDVSFTVVAITASINPFVYCWRLQELREAVKRQTKMMFKCCNGSENISN